MLSSVPIWEAETGRTFFVHGESILQLLINAAGTVEKENGSRSGTKRSKSQSRSGSAPARSRTPTNPIHNYVPRPGSSHGTTSNKIATTPATRPRSRSASTKRPRLGEATSTYNNVVPPVPAAGHPVLRSSRGAGTQRAPSPTKKVSVSTSLPRPVPLVAPVPRAGNQHSILGHGRAPSSQQKQQQPSHTYHPYPQTQRSSSRSTSSSQISVYGSAAFASSTRSAGAARKASRARRESFKPRPSTDGDWAGDTEGTKRWPGFAGGALTEEDDF